MLERPLKDTQETLWTYKVRESTGSISFRVKVNCSRPVSSSVKSIHLFPITARGHWGWAWAVPRDVCKLEASLTYCNLNTCMLVQSVVAGRVKRMLHVYIESIEYTYTYMCRHISLVCLLLPNLSSVLFTYCFGVTCCPIAVFFSPVGVCLTIKRPNV